MPSKFSFATAESEKSEKFKGLESDKLEDFKIRFAFDQISLDQKTICFNNPNIKDGTYLEMIEFAKYLSNVSLAEIVNDSDYLKLHTIDLHKKYFLKPILQEVFKSDTIDDLPDIYQLRAVGQDDYENFIAPRIVGYFGVSGVFHLLFFDYYHAIYPIKSCKAPEKWYKEYY
nr:hypothetical protein [uncultured Marinifilum sp.]